MDKYWFDDIGTTCNNCGTNYGDIRGFCPECGSTDLEKHKYNKDGVSGSLRCFENLITDKSKYSIAWNNIQAWFQNLP